MSGPAKGSWRYRCLHAGLITVALALAIRLFTIQVVHHDTYLETANIQWKQKERLAPKRGNLYDRHGRSLALSVTTWRVGVAGSLVAAGDRTALADSLGRLLSLEKKAVNRRLAAAGDSHAVVANSVVLSPSQLERLEGLAAVTLEPLASRIYPYGGVGASLIGFYRHDPQQGYIATGLEESLAPLLDGTPGEAYRLATALPGHSLGQIVLQQPRHGNSLQLTIDADLQTICEDRLAESVAACRAKGGTVLIADPTSGDILAAASWPLLPDRRRGGDPAMWINANFTAQYEPGSVFKLFTAASLLKHGAADTTTLYDCGEESLVKILNKSPSTAKPEPMPFMPAFAESRNPWFYQAVHELEDDAFYRDLLRFGFGQCTRFPYGGQPTGLLRAPADWSKRSKPTLSIGQEIAVTPLQLVMAVCAVANGGQLYAPRIVREVRDHEGQLLENCPPLPLRRVMSVSLAKLLRRAMRRVVTEGTGTDANLDWITIGGKTGTAQKCLGGRGYAQGKYIANFAGCVPADQSRLVILTLLDEPDYAHHYAAKSAVPLFSSIVRDIRRGTNWLTDVSGRTARALPAREEARLEVPDVMFLSGPVAMDIVHGAGLVLVGGERSGIVMEQIPGPGAVCAAGDTIRVTIRVAGSDATGSETLCPDLAGLSNREVHSRSAACGVEVEIAGLGYVVAQDPAPGTPLGGRTVHVRMESPWR